MAETALVVVALLAGLYMAWNIGANDVANAFGTPVGSGAITLKQALILAAIFEFCGCFFAGSQVTNTIRGDIVDPALFVGEPRLFAIGMVSALIGASLWLNVATYMSQPVSTTHAIIGSVVGFGVVAMGPAAIQWHKMSGIAASWVISPVVGAAVSFLIYHGILKWVLHAKNPVRRAGYAVPVGLAAMSVVMLYSILQSLFPRVLHMEKTEACWLAAGAALVAANLLGVLVWVIMRRLKHPGEELTEQHAAVERFFAKVQVMDACYLSLAPGANDVAHPGGPGGGGVVALQGSVSGTGQVPAWVLALGGAGIVVGLATFGYRVLEAVGKKITEVTPTRGFAAEFSTATTVLVCSLMGLPISTTFVLVGAVMGVGFARGFGAIDLRVVRKIFVSWVVTIPASAIATVGVYFLLRWWLR